MPHKGAARTAATSHIGLTHSDEHTTPICTFRCDNLLQRLSGTLNLHGKGWRKVSVGDKKKMHGRKQTLCPQLGHTVRDSANESSERGLWSKVCAVRDSASAHLTALLR